MWYLGYRATPSDDYEHEFEEIAIGLPANVALSLLGWKVGENFISNSHTLML